MSRQRTSAGDIHSRERMNQALQLRKAGASLDQVAKQCGYGSRSSAWKALRRAMAELPRENAEEYRSLELARYDELLLAWWQRAKKDIGAAHLVLKIADQRARLLGLNIEPVAIPEVHTILREVPQGYLREPEPASSNGAKPQAELTTT